MLDSFVPAKLPQISNISTDDLDEAKSIRRYWRWKGCKKWQDDFGDALDDYSDLQRKRIKLSKTRKKPVKGTIGSPLIVDTDKKIIG